MDYTTEENEKYVVVTPNGRIDHGASDELLEVLQPIWQGCSSDNARSLIVDLRGVEYMSSAGLRVLMVASREIKELGQSIGVCELSPIMKEIFEISRFSFVLDIYANLDEARAAMT
jgi:anti-sigma B factor antagonist/stage II sporulation protein AA (anti-sigma F factor antagonist)